MSAGTKSAYRSKTKQAMCASSAVSESVLRSKRAGQSQSSSMQRKPSRKSKSRSNAQSSTVSPSQSLFKSPQQQQQQPLPSATCKQQENKSGSTMGTIFESMIMNWRPSTNTAN